ncbi:MAG: hypothetical protein HQ567_19300, partial [Candidatus Nealsonbacteria bacterium]|nr:hypothetical protein [Candidatus Nealsonbacteria bacterium]
MQIGSCLRWWLGSLTVVLFGITRLASSGAMAAESPEPEKPAGSFEIPAWAFDRGNARVDANPGQYADYRDTYPELVAGGGDNADGDRLPWVVEYDVDFPVDATYTLHVRYASPESRPMELWLDGRKRGTCCAEVTGNLLPYPYRRPKVHDAQPRPATGRHGAQWEEAGKLPIAKGKHTLKLTCAASPPNVVALRLESPVAFPKDWKPAGHELRLPEKQGGERSRYELGWDQTGPMAKVNRIPPVYRTAFLPPGSVNVATLRMAIEDTIEEFGPRYPKGPAYLERLAKLERQQHAAMRGTADEMQQASVTPSIADSLQSLRREAMLSHPLLGFDRLLFVKRTTYSSSHIYSDHWDGSRTMGGNLCILSPVAPDGKVTRIAPQLDGGLFGRFDLSFDAKKIVFAYKKAENEGYRIYEINVDGTGLRQLTFDAPEEPELAAHYGERFRYEDCDPCYMPDGKIMFASTRSQRRVFCFGSTVTSLYLMDADGKDLRCLSGGPVNEMSPIVMNDGRVIYTRWEYVDKGFGNVQSLWTMRPDGSGSAHVYKNDVILPAGMINARSIPGSQRIVTVAAPHCGLSVGPIVLVDNRLNRRTAEAMTNITPELGYPGMSHHRSGQTFGYFKEPFPLSEKLFLVAHNPHSRCSEPTGYGIYALDAYGNRAELYRDPETSCFQPIPLRPRRRPTTIPAVAAADAAVAQTQPPKELEPATLFMQDVYRGLTGIERGRVKHLRVIEAIGVSWDEGWRSGQQGDGAGLQASAVSLRADVNIKKIHGLATVHEDGSAHFAVPAEKNLFFQALDENYMELQRMRTFVNLMPGEKRSCIGCHEHRKWAPQPGRTNPMAMSRPLETLSPQPGDVGPRTVHYARDIRPILDKHCVGCHGSQQPAGELDLGGELTKLYDRSYENFIDKGLVSHLNDGYGSANVAPELPLTFGSHRSKLVERIRHDPCRANLTRNEFIKIVTWIDANAP